MRNPTKPVLYRSFLLRMWRANDSPAWRFSLEDPHTGERHGLASLDRLDEFLKEVMRQSDEVAPNGEDRGFSNPL